jgi:tRNA A-37 threonylcarbamoyl transferase component Bud32
MSESPERQADAAAPVKELTGRIGKFEIEKPLGKGAMGMVYLAHDTVLEREVALKVMVAQIADDPELRKRFEREAKAVAKMTHPNVVTVFDLGYHEGSPYIAMERLKGMDLQKAMRQGPPMSLERKVAIITQVLAGLAHAHQAGIVHRDIKPANIYILHDGGVKIMDFGVARITTASMTGTGNIVGTADYMSPEQVKGLHVDGKSDVFAVGCMLFELLAGRRPFHADNLMAIFYKITHDDPNWDLIPGGPEYDTLLPILRKALAKELDERYQTAYEFAVDLRNYLKAHATSASGQDALEGLIDLEPPPSRPPQPLTDVPGAPTVVEGDVSGATVDLSAARGRGTAAPVPTTLRAGGAGATAVGGTRSGAPTVVPSLTAPGTMAPTVRAPVPQRPVRPRVEARPAPPPVKQGHPVLYAALGALSVALLASGGYIYWRHDQAQPTPPPPTQAPPESLAPTTLAPPTTAPPPTAPPTTAPPPTFAEATGKAAAAMRAAQRAFRDQDYDRAVSQAQSALRDEPASADARKLLDNAQAGQKALAQFRAAEQALGRSDFAAASAAALAGRELAPWDSRGPALQSRIQDAQSRAQAQQQAAAQQQQAQQQQALKARQLNEALAKADEALLGQKYDQAIAFYDEALRIDPENQRAIAGKGNAVQARVLAQTALGGVVKAGAGKTFVAGKTAASSSETRAGGSVPAGFEETAGVSV